VSACQGWPRGLTGLSIPESPLCPPIAAQGLRPEALAFSSLVLAIVSLVFVNRSFSASLVTALRRPNSALAVVLLAVTTMLSVTLLWPFARGLFRFGPLHLDDLALTHGAGVLVLVFLESQPNLQLEFIRDPDRLGERTWSILSAERLGN